MRQREPRQRDPDYLGFIAALPCVACLVEGRYTRGVHVAHLRVSSIDHDKRETGKAEKPDDKWTTPLCPPHHTGDSRRVKFSQHTMGELDFWDRLDVNPFELCLSLVKAYMHEKPGRTVLAEYAGAAQRARLRRQPPTELETE